MKVSVAYALPDKQVWTDIEVNDECTAQMAIEKSKILQQFQKIGIFGKFCKLDTPLKEGDRVEIYRAITADPKTVKRRDQDDDDED